MPHSMGSNFQPVGNRNGMKSRSPYAMSFKRSYSSFSRKQTGFATNPTPPVRKINSDNASITEQMGTKNRFAMGDATDTSRK